MSHDLPPPKKLSTPLTKGTEEALQSLSALKTETEMARQSITQHQALMGEQIAQAQTQTATYFGQMLKELQTQKDDLQDWNSDISSYQNAVNQHLKAVLETAEVINQSATETEQTIGQILSHTTAQATQLSEKVYNMNVDLAQMEKDMEEILNQRLSNITKKIEQQTSQILLKQSDDMMKHYNKVMKITAQKYWQNEPITIAIALIFILLTVILMGIVFLFYKIKIFSGYMAIFAVIIIMAFMALSMYLITQTPSEKE